MSARPFHCVISSTAPDASNYDEIRDRLIAAVSTAHREQDPLSFVKCEVYAGAGKLIVVGEACSSAFVHVEEVARGVLRACAREARGSQCTEQSTYFPEWVI